MPRQERSSRDAELLGSNLESGWVHFVSLDIDLYLLRQYHCRTQCPIEIEPLQNCPSKILGNPRWWDRSDEIAFHGKYWDFLLLHWS